MKKLLFWMILIILGAVGSLFGSFVGAISFLLWLEEKHPETGKRMTKIVKRFVSDGTSEMIKLIAYGDHPPSSGRYDPFAGTNYVPYNRPRSVPDPEAKEG